MSAGLLLPLPVKLSTFSTAPSSLSTPTLFTVSFAKTISNNLIFVKQSLSSKRPDFRVFADDGDADGGGTDEYDMDEDEVEEADNKKDFDVDYDTLLGGGSAISLAVARGDDDIAMVNSSSFVFTQGWDSEKIVDYRIKEEEFHKICLFDCDFFIRKPPDPDDDVYDFREVKF